MLESWSVYKNVSGVGRGFWSILKKILAEAENVCMIVMELT